MFLDCHTAGVRILPVLQIYPHGSTDVLPYATMGSGSLNAMAMFEAGYKVSPGNADV